MISVGPNDSACKRAVFSVVGGGAALTVEGDGGDIAFTLRMGDLTGDHRIATTVTGIRKGQPAPIPAEGHCGIETSADVSAMTALDCDTYSTYGQIRVRFVKAP